MVALVGAVLGLQAAAQTQTPAERRAGYYAPTYEVRAPSSVDEHIFAVHPLHNPQRLMERYGPLVDYLNANIPRARFRLEASRDYADFERKLQARTYHFALPNPYQTLVAQRYGYRVFGKMGDDDSFRGLIVVRRGGGIEQPADLKGKAMSFPASTALAATMLPQHFLQEQGVLVQRDYRALYVGSQESAIMNTYLGFSAATGTWPLPWEQFLKSHPDKARELTVQWRTDPLLNNGLVVREDVDPTVSNRVRDLIVQMHRNPQGRAVLARLSLSQFEPADAATYQRVDAFLQHFKKNVRAIDG